mmetsp:Transcript_3159/g.11247  ORF Transcript_3159/g.11247 Transcript_3159/m.11247 type:complete len:138 (-) Transcript_3159:127-540(-)
MRPGEAPRDGRQTASANSMVDGVWKVLLVECNKSYIWNHPSTRVTIYCKANDHRQGINEVQLMRPRQGRISVSWVITSMKHWATKAVACTWCTCIHGGTTGSRDARCTGTPRTPSTSGSFPTPQCNGKLICSSIYVP